MMTNEELKALFEDIRDAQDRHDKRLESIYEAISALTLRIGHVLEAAKPKMADTITKRAETAVDVQRQIDNDLIAQRLRDHAEQQVVNRVPSEFRIYGGHVREAVDDRATMFDQFIRLSGVVREPIGQLSPALMAEPEVPATASQRTVEVVNAMWQNATAGVAEAAGYTEFNGLPDAPTDAAGAPQ